MNNLEQFKLKYKPEIKTLKDTGRLTGEWSNVFDHCFKEGLLADVLSDLLQLASEDKEDLIKAALLHDWYKRVEREAANKEGFSQYDLKAVESGDKLKSLGYSDRIVELTQSVGHTSLKKVMESNDLLIRVMHLIDDITFGNKIVELDERVDGLEQAERYKELNEEGKKIFAGKTYFQIQRELGHQIISQICAKLEIKPDKFIPQIKSEFRKKYPTFAF